MPSSLLAPVPWAVCPPHIPCALRLLDAGTLLVHHFLCVHINTRTVMLTCRMSNRELGLTPGFEL